MNVLKMSALATAVLCVSATTHAQQAQSASEPVDTLGTIRIESSADASAGGLSPAYPGGQVAQGGRAGILGTRDFMETPFSITSYTSEFIQDVQARSVGDVLQSDPSVRVARGFGNFQESYFIRGFPLESDAIAYNGLYGILPRQYIAAELFERVEVLRGASTFLNGAPPGGQGMGGALNLLPKRAGNESLTRVSTGWGSGGQSQIAMDVSRRFGHEDRMGVRLNAARHGGGTSVGGEDSRLDLVSLGLDWRGDRLRLSGDIGWQENRLRRTRPSVTLASGTDVPDAPDADTNFAQPWTYSNERDLFGTLRGEYDITDSVTAWAAWGMRRTHEANSLAGVTVNDGARGDGTYYRFDNARQDSVDSGELGLRGKLRTGSVGHEWVVSASYYALENKGAYVMDFFNTFATNIYRPVYRDRPAISAIAFTGNEQGNPALRSKTRLTSVAVGDTLSLLDDRVLLTLGARHQQLRTQDFAWNTGIADPAYDDSRVSPAVGLTVKFAPDWSVYANYMESLAVGGSVTDPKAANYGQTLNPYVSKQKEIGIKFDGGELGAGLAFFTTDKPRGYLRQSDELFVQSGKDRHRGVELTVFGQAAKDVRVLGGATWIDAKQIDTGDAVTDGKRTIGVPKLQANMGLEWDLPWIDGLTVDGRVVYTGASYADANNTQEVPGWTRLDMGLRYLWEVDGRLVTLRARVDNLADRNYWASVGGYPGNGYLTLGAGRTVSLNASMEF
ncbi:TonB-dependent receptor [Castellaniella sp.]|uniref:TonB-dependent receptor n=1 Tax=Castellaniella sp. TaxID=1955812 RepID=UPI002AFEA98C|nr:TonB-dependent receptor [Castellaniella sp.]